MTQPMTTPDDFSVQDFRAILATLPAHLPISDAFERDLPQR